MSRNVDLILINPRVIAKSKCQNVITNPPVIAKSNQQKPKDLEASKSNVYYWLLLLWAMTTGAQLMDLDTLNYGGLGPHPRGGGGEGGVSYYEVNITPSDFFPASLETGALREDVGSMVFADSSSNACRKSGSCRVGAKEKISCSKRRGSLSWTCCVGQGAYPPAGFSCTCCTVTWEQSVGEEKPNDLRQVYEPSKTKHEINYQLFLARRLHRIFQPRREPSQRPAVLTTMSGSVPSTRRLATRRPARGYCASLTGNPRSVNKFQNVVI